MRVDKKTKQLITVVLAQSLPLHWPKEISCSLMFLYVLTSDKTRNDIVFVLN